jgi:tetratricopeptide (TPR) repeat protein
MMVPLALYVQDKPDAKAIVAQGVALHDAGKYPEAIAKYDEALRIDSTFQTAYYEKSYTLSVDGREKEAIPVLEKLLKLNPASGGAYDLLGTIYDDLHETDKAIGYYKTGIAEDPDYQRLHFNIAIAYYRTGKYEEAESAAFNAIRLDPKHASSQRIYAMACHAQGKRGCALLGYCSFLLLEPQTERAAEAFKNVLKIVNFGISKTGESKVNISVSKDDLNAANLIMPIAVINATQNKQHISATDSLQFQLTSLFGIAHNIVGDKAAPAIAHYYADYFDRLAKSGNMAAFTRLISLSAWKKENLDWFKQHPKELSDLDSWVKDTPRNF